MQVNLEILEGLARRLDIGVPMSQVEAEVQSRLKRMSHNVKMDGFRPGKAPMAAIARQYAPGIRQEILGESLQNQFGQAVQSQQLRIAGYPRFEPKAGTDGASELVFSALFEVYPDVSVGALNNEKISKPVVTIGEAEIDKTLEVLQKQRRSFDVVGRAATEGDLIKFDYQGTIAGEAFTGGNGQDLNAVIGEGRLLKEFEQNLTGLKAGDNKGFDLTFPDNYSAQELAGKLAHFEIQVKEIQAPSFPAVDAEFARALGVDDGDVSKLKAEVKSNLEREVKRRTQARMREQVMELLLQKSVLDLPQSLIGMEIERLQKMTEADMQSKGVQTMKLSADMFKEQAERRVKVGLILAEVVQKQKLVATPDQIRALIEDQAQSYEAPEEVLQWYYQSPERMQEIESLALEENVVAWAAGQAQVEDVPTSFEELMGRA
ncbi:MAG: trigger factor [Thiobacillaceae bacterium]